MKKITPAALGDDLAQNATYQIETTYLTNLADRTQRQRAELAMRQHYLNLATDIGDTIIASGHTPIITWLFAPPSAEQDKQVAKLEIECQAVEQKHLSLSSQRSAVQVLDMREEVRLGIVLPVEMAFALNKALLGKYDTAQPLLGVPSNSHAANTAIARLQNRIAKADQTKVSNAAPAQP